MYVQNDRFDGIVIAAFLELLDDRAGIDNDAFELDHTDLVAKAAQRASLAASVQREIHQREHCQHDEEKRSSSNDDPKPGARTTVIRHRRESRSKFRIPSFVD